MMERDFFLGATVDRVPDVFGSRAVDRDRLRKRLVKDANRPWLEQNQTYDPTLPRFRRWVWTVTNTTDGELLATGAAWTKRAAIRRKHRAFVKALAAVHAEREQTAAAPHPFGDRCPHGTQFLDQCDTCPGGWQPAAREQGATS